MSRRKDRERAESGLIFRDGHLVRKEDWYKTHPTAEMKREQQSTVDKAVAEHFRQKELERQGILIVKDGKVLDPKDTSAVLAEAEPYYCTKCKVTHRSGTKVHEAHHQFASQITVV
jgi:exopolysaccharide biosynthesis protein